MPSANSMLTLQFVGKGGIKGASQVEPGAIDITPFSLEMSHPGAYEFSNAGTGVSGKAGLSPVTISMMVEECTADIMTCSQSGMIFDQVIITSWGSINDKKPDIRTRLILKEVMIGSVTVWITGEGQPESTIWLYYKARDYCYVPLGDLDAKKTQKHTIYNQVTGKSDVI